jgi:hypothetical protein
MRQPAGSCKIRFAIFLLRQSQNTAPQRMNQLPLVVIQCSPTQGIHYRSQLARLGTGLFRRRTQLQPPLALTIFDPKMTW